MYRMSGMVRARGGRIDARHTPRTPVHASRPSGLYFKTLRRETSLNTKNRLTPSRNLNAIESSHRAISPYQNAGTLNIIEVHLDAI